MTDIDSLIEQAARELQISVDVAKLAADDDVSPRKVTIQRKDGSTGSAEIPARADYSLVHLLLKSQSKSAAKAEQTSAEKQARIDQLEAELKALKGQ